MVAEKKILWCDSLRFRERRRIRGFLKENHCVVITADTVEQLEKLLALQPFDLLVTEIMISRDQSDFDEDLVDLDAGFKVLSKLKQGAFWDTNIETPIIVLTGRGDLKLLAAIKAFLTENGGGNNCLLRFCSNQELEKAISKALGL